MLHDIVHHQEQLTIELHQTSKEEVSSSSAHAFFKFYESELFLETHQNISEVASSSNVGDEEYSSKPTTNVSSVLYNSNYNNNDNDNSDNLSLVFDNSQGEIENNTVFASIDFNHSTNNIIPQFLNNQLVQQYDISSLNNQIFHEANDIISNESLNHQFNNNLEPPANPLVTTSSLLLPHSFKDESLATFVSSYTQTNPTTQACSLLNSGLGTHMSTALPICDNMNLTMPGLYLGSDLATQDINFLVDNNLGHNFHNTIPPIFDCNDNLQALTNENQLLIEGHSKSTPLTSEIVSNLEESSDFKVGKLSVEERKEKINRYIKKRNKRNFGKKIKYACRKTLADSRPRVRGRFAKYDDLIEAATDVIMNLEEDEEEVDLARKFV